MGTSFSRGEQLLETSKRGTYNQVLELLEQGTDVNVRNVDGFTPLHFACCHGRLEIVNLLLQNGADVHARNRFGNTPLEDAVVKAKGDGNNNNTSHHLEAIKLLVEKAANAKDDGDFTEDRLVSTSDLESSAGSVDDFVMVQNPSSTLKNELTKVAAPLIGVDEDTDRAEKLKKQANAKFNKGQVTAARQLYTDAIGCMPTISGKYSEEIKHLLSMLYSNRGVTFFRDGMYAESLGDCEKVIELDPTLEKGYIRKARSLRELGRLQESFECLQEASKVLPNSKKIAEELRKRERDDGRIPSAPNTTPTSKLLSKNGADDNFSYELELVDKLKRNANAKFNRGDIIGARLLYTEALDSLPDDTGNETVQSTLAALYSNRAVTLFREKEFGPSTLDCDKAMELDPTSEKPYIRKARALTAMSRQDDARDCLKKGVHILPTSSRLKEELAKVESSLEGPFITNNSGNDGDTVRAVVLEMEVPHHRDNEDITADRAEKLKKQANAKLNKGEVEAARQLYSEAIGCMPTSGGSKYSEEIKHSLSKLYSNRAVTFFRDKMFDESLADCEKAIELDPTNEEGYTRKARALMWLKGNQEALECLQQGNKVLPNSQRIAEELHNSDFDSTTIVKEEGG